MQFLAFAAVLALAILIVTDVVPDHELRRGALTVPTVPLTIGLYKDGHSFPARLYRQYEKAHPGVEITQRLSDYAGYETALEKNITAGQGADDLQVVELPYMSRFAAQPKNFANLLPDGDISGQWTPALLNPATAPDTSVVGLPIDVGGMAICYRKDLFARAGLPTDRVSVSAMFNSWTAYVRIGRRFIARSRPGTFWFDSGIHLLNGILGSEPASAIGDPATFDAADSAAVKQAWDLTASAITAKESAKLSETAFAPALRGSRFATTTCPAWRLGQIKRADPSHARSWDLAQVPGGSGNWSGSFVTVPSQGAHVKAAVELARWLVQPSQQAVIYTDFDNFPSSPQVWHSPLIENHRDPYFSNAPVGQIIAASLESAKPSKFYGLSGLIATASQPQLVGVDHGLSTAATAWPAAKAAIAQATRGG